MVLTMVDERPLWLLLAFLVLGCCSQETAESGFDIADVVVDR